MASLRVASSPVGASNLQIKLLPDLDSDCMRSLVIPNLIGCTLATQLVICQPPAQVAVARNPGSGESGVIGYSVSTTSESLWILRRCIGGELTNRHALDWSTLRWDSPEAGAFYKRDMDPAYKLHAYIFEWSRGDCSQRTMFIGRDGRTIMQIYNLQSQR
jgi:hypothetical protein